MNLFSSLFSRSSVKWQQWHIAKLIGEIYRLRELTSFLCVLKCVYVCLSVYISVQTHFASCKWARTNSLGI
jgi:hypothetical protein